MPRRIEGTDTFNPKVLSPRKGDRNYDDTVYCTLQSFADRTIWLKNRVVELQDYLGDDSGSAILVGNGAPAEVLGVIGDLYIDSENGVFYIKTDAGWVLALDVSNFGSKIYSDSGIPADTLGNDGDLYIDTDTSNFFHKISGSWVTVLDISSIDNGLLDTINDIDAIDKNIDLVPGTGIEIVPNTGTGTITIQLYTNPTASISNNIGNVEIGTTVTSVNLNWNYNKTEVSQSLNNGIGTLPIGDRSYTHTPVSITSSETYTITLDDGTNSVSANTTIRFFPTVYWGTNSATSLTTGDILGLPSSKLSNSKTGTFSINGNSEYLYYAYPQSFGAATFIVNGLLNSAWTEEIVSHTNSSGYTQNYRVYRSDYIQNGTNIQVEVQ